MSSISASLGSPAFFTPSLFALQDTANRLATSTARLSSGNRLINISDDVASFSIATRLQSQLSGLKQASVNVVQGDSLLQVAQGGLSQIVDLLNSSKAVATQANSSSLSASERSFLQQQFAEYLEEIDRISATTSFNNILLLNGNLSGANKALTQTTNATKASGSITFTGQPNVGETIVINGVTFTADTDFAIGGTAAATATNLYNTLAASTNTALTGVTYANPGAGTISITAKAGGALGNQFVIDEANSTAAAAFAVTGATTNAANIFTLTGGTDNGLNINSVKGVGTVGDTLLTAQAQTPASVTLFITGTISNGEQLRLDNGNAGLINFTFADSPAGATDIQIGATVEETLQNAVDVIRTYTTANAAGDNYGLRQLDFRVDGNNLVISNRTVGNATDLAGAALDISETLTNGSLSGASFNNGATGGVGTSGITNGDFVGEIQGVTATYVSPDVVDLSLTVGSHTYSGRVSDTTPAGDTTVRLSSTNGGYLDLRLDGGQGTTVANQTNADTFAARVNSALAGLTFYQDRPISNFTASGTLIGASASIQLDNFSDVRLDSISVTAPVASGGDGTIEFVINGDTFRANAGLGGRIGEQETVQFTSLTDASKVLTFTNGSTAQDFTTANGAAAFETALRTAFGLSEEGDGVELQIGIDPADTVNIVVQNVSTDQIFNGVTPDVSTQGNAATAQGLIDEALSQVQSVVSTVGAIQQRLSVAGTVIGTTIQGVTQARSNLADTDIAEESTTFAQETLKLNAAVAVIAQAQNLQSSLLTILQVGLGK